MSGPRKEWNLPLRYRREGIFLYHLPRSMWASWDAVLFARSLNTFRSARCRFAWDKGTFLLTSPWGNMATPGGME
jgi:hypothetical protein